MHVHIRYIPAYMHILCIYTHIILMLSPCYASPALVYNDIYIYTLLPHAINVNNLFIYRARYICLNNLDRD